MKKQILYIWGIALMYTLVFACPKGAEAQLVLSETLSSEQANANEVGESTVECSCGIEISGEPTMVTGIFTYPEEALNFDCSIFKPPLVTVKYNALTVPNRFKIIGASGSVAMDTGWVMGIGTRNFCVIDPPYSLVVSAKTTVTALDRWKVSFKCDSGCY
jgi:hypothetical protein